MASIPGVPAVTKNLRTLGGLLAIVASGGWTPAALAQQPGKNQPVLEEVTVTARRVEENIMYVPMSVTSISAQDVEAMGLKDMTDISSFTPSFHFVNQVGGGSGFNDRGQANITFRGLTLPLGVTDNGSGSLFVDGAPVSAGQGVPSIDEVERVEVLKGPQSAYFGRSTFAGAINYVTRDPSLTTFKGSASAEASSYSSTDDSLSLEGPLVRDVLGARITVHHLVHGGEWTNAANSNQMMGAQTTDSVSATFLARPNEHWKIKAWFNFFRDDDGPPADTAIKDIDGLFNCSTHGTYAGGYLCGPVPNADRLNPANISGNFVMTPFLQSILVNNSQNFPLLFRPDFLNHFGLAREDVQGDIRIDYEAPGFTISSLTAYHADKSQEYIDLAFRDETSLPNPFAFIPGTLPYWSFSLGVERVYNDWSEEIRATSAQDKRLRWTIGANYLHTIIPSYPSLWGELPVGTLDLSNLERFYTNTPAIFGGVSFDITKALTLAAEARYQWDRLQNTAIYVGTAPATGTAAIPLENTFKSFSPRISLDYKYADNSSAYVLWSRGYHPGGFNSYVVTLTPAQIAQLQSLGAPTNLNYAEERLDNLEIGLKSTFLDGRARTLLALYYDLYRNGQVGATYTYQYQPGNPSSPVNQIQGTSNAGAIDLKGLEFSGDWLATKNLKLAATFALNQTEVKDYSPCSDAIDITGATSCNGSVPGAPKLTWSLSGEYTDHLAGAYDWFSRIDYAHRGKEYTDYTNLNWLQDSNVVNLRLGIRTEALLIEGFVRNLTNDQVPQGAIFQSDTLDILRIPPQATSSEIRLALPDKRTFGVRVRLSF